jgi:mono/diheme cytochrome c family protein
MLSEEESGRGQLREEDTGTRTWKRPWLVIRILIALSMIAGIIFGYLLFFNEPHMRNQPIIKTYQALMPSMPEGTVQVNPRLAVSDMPDSASNPLQPIQANLDRGKVYYGYYCAFCHGEKGDGNGPVGESYIPVPSDLRTPEIRELSDSRLYRAMLTGDGHAPVLERIIPREHRWYIVLYVRSLSLELLDKLVFEYLHLVLISE